jgi:hypothetical protein
MKIVTNWEASGNGTGQRAQEDKDFGRFVLEDCIDGDNRASFVRESMGHKIHHLCLWHISDKMGVLKHVLHVLSAEVAYNGDIPHQSTQQVQRATEWSEQG